ncbi:hypothetical protein BJ322DRAFT_1217821 [Thelephora terrestris]|uniref:Uncharacterized protein n=1 Tax=Thelephora terrestris TaxID=56493 RepID=A0A9P6HH59_9AGAM|nr:hypothetical protein BJ322DRAFT_1217821 [Thelephora terrestris]
MTAPSMLGDLESMKAPVRDREPSPGQEGPKAKDAPQTRSICRVPNSHISLYLTPRYIQMPETGCRHVAKHQVLCKTPQTKIASQQTSLATNIHTRKKPHPMGIFGRARWEGGLWPNFTHEIAERQTKILCMWVSTHVADSLRTYTETRSPTPAFFFSPTELQKVREVEADDPDIRGIVGNSEKFCNYLESRATIPPARWRRGTETKKPKRGFDALFQKSSTPGGLKR